MEDIIGDLLGWFAIGMLAAIAFLVAYIIIDGGVDEEGQHCGTYSLRIDPTADTHELICVDLVPGPGPTVILTTKSAK